MVHRSNHHATTTTHVPGTNPNIAYHHTTAPALTTSTTRQNQTAAATARKIAFRINEGSTHPSQLADQEINEARSREPPCISPRREVPSSTVEPSTELRGKVTECSSRLISVNSRNKKLEWPIAGTETQTGHKNGIPPTTTNIHEYYRTENKIPMINSDRSSPHRLRTTANTRQTHHTKQWESPTKGKQKTHNPFV